MKESVKYTLPEQTHRLLDAGRMKDALTLLRRRLLEMPLPEVLNKVSQAENSYRYMLRYFQDGQSDPGRESMLSSLRSDLLSAADRIDKETNATDSSALYFATLRMCRLRPASIETLMEEIIRKESMVQLSLSADGNPTDLIQELEGIEEKLFNTLWTSDSLSAREWKALSGAISSQALPFSATALAISATGLGLMQYYDREALQLLVVACGSDSEKISARAIATLLLVALRQKDRIAYDGKAMEMLASLADSEGMASRLRAAVINAVRTRDTDRVSRKMQRDVIPGLMQFGPDILKKMKSASEESSFSDLEGNPEWEEILQNSGLEDKLRELTEMQQEGADVMMVPFSNLKGFPFFRTPRNWLLPFSMRHTSLRMLSDSDNEALSAMLELNGMMCDSDKYSFAFSLASMAAPQRNGVLEQMRGQAEAMKEQLKELEFLKGDKKFDSELTRYFRDLYRFHKLFAKRGEFFDPFASEMDFTNLPIIGSQLGIDDTIAPLAEFYFTRGYYKEALPLLQAVASDAADTPHIWEKIGFALEKTGAPASDAIDAYMKGQLFNPDSRWIAKRLAGCFRQQGKFRDAAENARMAMPEDGSFDRSLSLLLADILADDGRWEDALKELYRVDYETPGDPEVMRKMAAAAFHLRNLDKAEQWLSTIGSLSLIEEDYRMMGHIAFIKGDMKKAMEKYRLTVRSNDTKRLWKSSIMSEAPILEKLGADMSGLPLLMESLAYELEN